MNVTEQVKQAIYDAMPVNIGDLDDSDMDNVVTAAITAFLKAAAEQGWCLVPAEPTEEMIESVSNHGSLAATTWVHYADVVYREYLEASPKFKLETT